MHVGRTCDLLLLMEYGKGADFCDWVVKDAVFCCMRGISLLLLLLFFFDIYLFIWPCWVLVETCRIFRVFSCNIRILSCGMWDLVPWSGMESWTPCIGSMESLPLDHQGSLERNSFPRSTWLSFLSTFFFFSLFYFQNWIECPFLDLIPGKEIEDCTIVWSNQSWFICQAGHFVTWIKLTFY